MFSVVTNMSTGQACPLWDVEPHTQIHALLGTCVREVVGVGWQPHLQIPGSGLSPLDVAVCVGGEGQIFPHDHLYCMCKCSCPVKGAMCLLKSPML